MRCLLAVTALAWSVAAVAQDFPSKPLRVVSGFAAGGAADLVGRLVSQHLSTALRQPVVVENRPGAAGIIASEFVLRSGADGHTLLVGSMTTNAIAPSLYKKLPYDVAKDFAPIILIGHIPLVMSINAAVPAATLQDFVALVKASPGKYSFATAGGGTPPHLAGELVKSKFGLDMIHVPYKGTAPAVTDLVAGQVTMTFDGLTVQLPHIKSGKLRALASGTPKRLASIADVPTFTELGYPDLEMSLWYGLFAPAGTPKPIVNQLNAEVAKILALPEVRQRLAELAVEPGDGASAERYAAYVQSEIARWAKVVQQAGIRLD